MRYFSPYLKKTQKFNFKKHIGQLKDLIGSNQVSCNPAFDQCNVKKLGCKDVKIVIYFLRKKGHFVWKNDKNQRKFILVKKLKDVIRSTLEYYDTVLDLGMIKKLGLLDQKIVR